MNTPRLLVTAAMAVLLGGSTQLFAQTPPPGTAPPPPPQHRTLGFHRRPRTMAGSTVPIPGGIIGNKRTHVYHLPGDTGSLPAPQNRVYFRTEAEAVAAHYHAAKKRGVAHMSTHRRLPSFGRPRTLTPGGQPPNTTPPPPAPKQ